MAVAANAAHGAAGNGDASSAAPPLHGERGIAVGEEDHQKMAALTLAVQQGAGIAVRDLLAAGARPDPAQPLLCLAIGADSRCDVVFDVSKDPFPLTYDHSWLAGDGLPTKLPGDEASRTSVVRQLLDPTLGVDVERRSPAGRTPLVLAAVSGQSGIVSLLLEHDASINAATSSGGITPVFAAAAGGHHDIITQLADHGGDMNRADHRKLTPLHIAAIRRHSRVVSLLLGSVDSAGRSNVKINEADKNGETPLYWATSVGHVEITGQLIARDGDLDKASLYDGFTPLMNAIQAGMGLETISQLISSPLQGQQLQTNVHAASKAGDITALHLAARRGNTAVVEHLLESGANPLAVSKSYLQPIDMLPHPPPDDGPAGQSAGEEAI